MCERHTCGSRTSTVYLYVIMCIRHSVARPMLNAGVSHVTMYVHYYITLLDPEFTGSVCYVIYHIFQLN
jgi:hypothetical protein